MPEKPLFIPLKTEWYEAFERGDKGEELRLYGPRWNERTCRVGRAVVLSKGYGKAHRMAGRIWKFKRQHGSTFGSTYKNAIQRTYGTLNVEIACISIERGEHVEARQGRPAGCLPRAAEGQGPRAGQGAGPRVSCGGTEGDRGEDEEGAER